MVSAEERIEEIYSQMAMVVNECGVLCGMIARWRKDMQESKEPAPAVSGGVVSFEDVKRRLGL